MEEGHRDGSGFLSIFLFSFLVRIRPIESTIVLNEEMHPYSRALGKASLEVTSKSSVVPSCHVSLPLKLRKKEERLVWGR